MLFSDLFPRSKSEKNKGALSIENQETNKLPSVKAIKNYQSAYNKMRFTTSALSAFLLVATNPVVNSFVPASRPNEILSRSAAGASEPLFISPEDLTNYMAKAHEEKLRAVSEVEAKKNAEIEVRKNNSAETKLGFIVFGSSWENLQAFQKYST